MNRVWIAHPHLDDGERKIAVPESALHHYRRSGWVETDPPPPPTPRHLARRQAQTTEAPADAGASSLPETTPRGRRSSKGDQ